MVLRAHLRRQGRHLGGTRPFGWRVEADALGKPMLIGRAGGAEGDPADAEAAARRQDADGKIRDLMRAEGFQISHETVRQLIVRCLGAPDGWPDNLSAGPQVPQEPAPANRRAAAGGEP
jgi:hypothetical protein